MDALDAVKGTASSLPGKTGLGAKAALAGLAAVNQQGWHWRAAVAGALLGLSMLGGQGAPLVGNGGPQTRVLLSAAQGRTERARPSAFEAPRSSLVDARVLAQQEHVVAAIDRPTAKPAGPMVARGLERGALPTTLATLVSGMKVVHGTDPGDFYCEHAFFTTTADALRPGSSVLRNHSGEVLTGFLHVPSDVFTGARDDANKVQSQRHAERREVVGAAIRGFYEDAQPQIGDGPFRMLVTGYLQWGSVVDNPTGDFVSHQENVDAAMKTAFGADLLTKQGKVLESVKDVHGMSRDQLQYLVRDASSSTGERVVLIDAARLPVADQAINGGSSSLQTLMCALQPHAVMSMGVSGGSSSYQAEFHADDGGLHTDASGNIVHDDSKSPSTSHTDNFSLGRAIHRGQRLIAARPVLVAASALTDLGGG